MVLWTQLSVTIGSKTLVPTLQRYKAEDVFNADETSIYWRLLPDKTHAIAGKTCSGEKQSKERITVLVCANMTGSEKVLADYQKI